MIRVVARFDEVTLLPGLRDHLRRKIRRKIGKYALFTGVVFLLSLVPLFHGGHFGIFPQGMLGAATLAMGWIFFSYDRLFIKALKKNPNYGKSVEWTLSPERFSCETEGSKTEIAWSSLFEVYEGRGGFLIYPQENLFHYLPFASFAPGQIEEVRSYFPPEKVRKD